MLLARLQVFFTLGKAFNLFSFGKKKVPPIADTIITVENKNFHFINRRFELNEKLLLKVTAI